MAWIVLTSTRFDFEAFERNRAADRSPRHLVPEIAQRLDGDVEQPDPDEVRTVDRLGGFVYGRPEHWALARRVLPRLDHGDSVFTVGCDSGVPLALLCGLRRRRVAFAITFADPGRKKTRILGHILTRLLDHLLVFVATDHQARRALATFGARSDGVHVVDGSTDCDFFRPPERRPLGDPPVVAGCGVERRDYALMARALEGLDADAEVCFVSPNQDAKTQFTMPDPVPDRFEFRRYEFDELRDLYGRADLVVVPLLRNEYSAGLTTLFEAMACAAPVVVTESPGIIQRLVDDGLVRGAPPGDMEALRGEIEKILSNPEDARTRGLAGPQGDARSVLGRAVPDDVGRDPAGAAAILSVHRQTGGDTDRIAYPGPRVANWPFSAPW